MPNLNTKGRIDRFNIAQDYTATVYKIGTQHFAEKYNGDQIIQPTTDAYTAIIAAVNYVIDTNGRAGGKLYIAPGTYVLSAMVNIVGNKITVYGEPETTVIQTTGEMTAFKVGTGVYNGGATATRYEKVEFKDFAINMNGSSGTDVYGIWFHTCDNFYVENVHIYGQVFAETRSAAITWDYCTGGEVVSCHVHDVVNGIVPRKGSKGSRVAFNHVHDTLRYDGITPYQGEGFHTIIGNYVHDCADNGILIDGGPDGRNPETNVIGNVTHDNVHDGIETFGCYRTNITGNQSFNNGWRGISASTCGEEGFTIVGNTVRNNTLDGMRVFESRYGTISGNKIYDNTTNGIWLDTSANYNTVNGNSIYLNGEHGILVDESAFNAISGNTIKDNSQTTDDASDEIFLTATATHNAVTGNVIRSNETKKAKYLIEEDTAADDNNSYVNNLLDGGNQSPRILLMGVDSIAQHNKGYNPVGLIGNPWPTGGALDLLNVMSGGNGTPALDTIYVIKQTDKTIIIKGGTVTDININSSSTGLTSGVFTLTINSTIEIKGSGAPTTGVIRAE